MANETVKREKYTVRIAKFIGGLHYAAGEVIELTPAQAKYYLPPHSETLEPYKPASKRKKSAASAS